MRNSPLVLITGASQGIGAAIAKVFAKEVPGVRLALVARNEKNLRAVAKACMKTGSKVVAEIFVCDVSNETSVAAMAAQVEKRFGTVDVLINNAGKFAGAPFTKTTVAMFDEMVASNLRSAFLVSRMFV
ncbi:MAG TPA: SDR family oxidoreductase, partial [Opitutaceae bacterium]|nr:SDR family oxidoreductase [Opitutaceae bacterium]